MARLMFLLTMLVVSGCSNDLDRPIKIILPSDFTGEFRIVKDQSGTRPQVTPDFYIYTIPNSGELLTLDISDFENWHQLVVEYQDGRVLMDMTQDLYDGHGFRITNGSTTAGSRQTGPSSWESSSDYDGTIMRWEVSTTP